MTVRKKTAPAAKMKPCKVGDIQLRKDCYQLFLVAAVKKGADCSSRIVIPLSKELANLSGGKLGKKAASSRRRK